MASWFDEVITPEERKELEASTHAVCRVMQVGTIVAANITDLIDAKMPDA